MKQTDLFPRATKIVEHLNSYASEISKEIDRLEDAIDKKKGEASALKFHLQDLQRAIGDAQAFAAALSPTTPAGDEIVEVIKDEGAFDVDE